jgi:calmodulin
MDDLPETRLKEFKEAFDTYDKNRDGTITVSELALVMRSLNMKPTEILLNEIISEWDKDKSDRINFEEFVKLMKARPKDVDIQEEIINAFRVFDRDGSGFISTHELKNIIISLGEGLSEEEIDAMILEADIDGDGYINYEEFVMTRMNK